MKEFDYTTIDFGYYHKAMLYGSKIQRFWHTRKFLRVADLINDEDSLVFDVGSGPGSFFYVLRNKNKKSRLIGSDLIFNQARYAKNLKTDSFWLVSDASNLPCRKDCFDVMTMVEVIEHLPKELEKKIFSEIYYSLKKDGKFILTTPNYRSLWPVIEWFWNKISSVNYEDQHINKKTLSSLVGALENCGFKVVHKRTFFIMSPFVAVLSFRIADAVLKIEQKLLPFLGSLIIIEVKK